MMVVVNDIMDDSKSIVSQITTPLQKVSFSQALRDKYVEQEEINDQFIVPKDRKISTAITFVGFGKVSSVQKQLYRLTSIDLSGRRIEYAGDLGDLQGSLDRVLILNLADNTLAWHEIVKILPSLPNLRELIISGNQLTAVRQLISGPDQSTRHLSSLSLGKIDLNWTSIIRVISSIWCRVDELDLWSNQLSNSEMKLDCANEFDSFIEQITSLKLSRNNFPDLSWVSKAGPLRNLIELDVSRCQIESLNIDEDTAKQLQNLRVLNVSYNNLDDWRSISELYKLPNLRNLICHENPFYISEKFAKSLTIGRLNQITSLNREEITQSVRRDSEIFYLRRTLPEYMSFKEGKNDGFKLLHPRYEDIAHIYGLPEDLTRKHLVDKYVTVELCFGDKTITKKLPCDMRVANVHMLCKRLFKLKPSSSIELVCCCLDESGGSKLNYVLDKEGQTLHFFSVKNGQKLSIRELV